MSVDRKTVERIAKLAHIRLEEADLDGLALELNKILGWIEQLGQIDTKSVPPMTSVVQLHPPLRADEVASDADADLVTAGAPKSLQNFFVVPKVVE